METSRVPCCPDILTLDGEPPVREGTPQKSNTKLAAPLFGLGVLKFSIEVRQACIPVPLGTNVTAANRQWRRHTGGACLLLPMAAPLDGAASVLDRLFLRICACVAHEPLSSIAKLALCYPATSQSRHDDRSQIGPHGHPATGYQPVRARGVSSAARVRGGAQVPGSQAWLLLWARR